MLALRAGFAKNGIAAVTATRKRKRQPKVLTAEVEQRILEATLNTRPGDGSTHWSVRTMAKHLSLSRSTVHRVRQKHDVQPHRVERFKPSKGPRFEEKVRDIVGLYLNPPDRALNRTAPILPSRPVYRSGRPATTNAMARPLCSLRSTFLMAKSLAPAGIATGAGSFVRFLHYLEKQLPADQEIHLIMDNACTHKSAEVQRWLKYAQGGQSVLIKETSEKRGRLGDPPCAGARIFFSTHHSINFL